MPLPEGKRLIVLSLGGAEAMVLATQLEAHQGIPSLLKFVPPLMLGIILAAGAEFGPQAAHIAGLLSLLILLGVFVSPQGKSFRDMIASIAGGKPPTPAQAKAAAAVSQPAGGAKH